MNMALPCAGGLCFSETVPRAPQFLRAGNSGILRASAKGEPYAEYRPV